MIPAHGEKQALPRWGTAAIFALAAYAFLTPMIGKLMGVEVSGGHGAEAHGAASSANAWIPTAIALLAGGAIGWGSLDRSIGCLRFYSRASIGCST